MGDGTLGRDIQQEERRFWLRLIKFTALPYNLLAEEVKRHDEAITKTSHTYAQERLCVICAFRREPFFI